MTLGTTTLQLLADLILIRLAGRVLREEQRAVLLGGHGGWLKRRANPDCTPLFGSFAPRLSSMRLSNMTLDREAIKAR